MAASKAGKSGKGQATSRGDSLASVEVRRSSPRVARSAAPAIAPVWGKLRGNRTDGNLLEVEIRGPDSAMGTVIVARPPELRADTYDGVTINGVTYAKVDEDTRTATDGANPDETQKVTPDYLDSGEESELILIRLPGGTGLTDPDRGNRPVVWQDITPGRTWAVEAGA